MQQSLLCPNEAAPQLLRTTTVFGPLMNISWKPEIYPIPLRRPRTRLSRPKAGFYTGPALGWLRWDSCYDTETNAGESQNEHGSAQFHQKSQILFETYARVASKSDGVISENDFQKS